MSKHGDFSYDNDVYGKFGEKDFKEYCAQRGHIIKDVSDDFVYQVCDIDFLLRMDGIDNFDADKRRLIMSAGSKGYDGIYKVEVKCDTRAHKTRNVLYEVIAHDFAGCLGASKADYIYYVFVDDSGETIEKKEVWFINLTKWREYLRNYYFTEKIFVKDKLNKYGLRGDNYSKNNANGANILCNIEKLSECKIAKKIY